MLDIVKSLRYGAIIWASILLIAGMVNVAVGIVKNGLTEQSYIWVLCVVAVYSITSIAQYFLEKSENK